MIPRLLLFIGISILIAAPALAVRTNTQVEGAGENSTLEGRWAVRAAEKGSRKGTHEEVNALMLEFSGTRCIWKAAGKTTELIFTLDPSKSPKQIDLSADGKKLAGIYELTGDKLKICLSASGQRPSRFVADQAEKTMVLEMERLKR